MNISKAKEYLARNNVTLLGGGKSGARVYELEGGYVLKCTRREDFDNEATYETYRREALWYEAAGKSGLCCLPEVVDIRNTEEEIVVLMRLYHPLSRSNMEEGLLQKIMEAIAMVHCAEPPAFLRKRQQSASLFTEQQKTAAVAGWQSVLREHPGVFDEAILNKIATNINSCIEWHNQEETVLIHGDFHWDNLLLNERGDVIICDWQGVSAGQGSGDLSFFFSRLKADGVCLDKRKIVGFYEQAIRKLSGRTVTWESIRGHMDVANLTTSFLFWHEYLHGCTRERVQGIYTEMAAAFCRLCILLRTMSLAEYPMA